MTADLSALIARLEAAEVGSRELDAHVLQAAAVPEGCVEQSRFNGAWCIYVDGKLWQARGWWREHGWPVTASLDAALALAERVLPGWYWRAGRTPLGHWHHGRYTYGWAHVSRTDASNCDRGDEATGWAATPALALCIAILRAKQGEG